MNYNVYTRKSRAYFEAAMKIQGLKEEAGLPKERATRLFYW
jgi:hypothetical protein